MDSIDKNKAYTDFQLQRRKALKKFALKQTLLSSLKNEKR